MKSIRCSLTKKGSLENAIKQLEEYKKDLNRKTELFVEELARVGVNIAMMTLATKGRGDSPRDADFAVEINNDGEAVRGVITVSSSSILMWEFGAGIKFNGMTSPNPKAAEFGMGPGTYPGQTHVPDPGFWFYYDENGNSHYSVGTEATMPMHSASMEIIDNIYRIAREVFHG